MQGSPKRRRLSKAEALEQARLQLREQQARPKDPRAAGGNQSGPARDRDRWIPLPKHLACYAEEQAVISHGSIWNHRIDPYSATVDADGVRHTPVSLVSIGPLAALDPNYQRENPAPGQPDSEGDKTPGFVLGAGASRSIDHSSETGRVLSPLGGRPKKSSHDDLIMQLASEGKGSKAIARSLGRLGVSLSYRTVARRLSEFKQEQLGMEFGDLNVTPLGT